MYANVPNELRSLHIFVSYKINIFCFCFKFNLFQKSVIVLKVKFNNCIIVIIKHNINFYFCKYSVILL